MFDIAPVSGYVLDGSYVVFIDVYFGKTKRQEWILNNHQ